MRKSRSSVIESFRTYFIVLIIIVDIGIANAFEFSKEVCEDYGLGSNWYCNKVDRNKIPDLPIADPQFLKISWSEII